MFTNLSVHLDTLSGKLHDSCRAWYTKYMSTICAIYTGLTNNVVVTDWYIHVATLDKNIPDGLLYSC